MSDYFSLVEYFEDKEGYKCGYCKSKDSSFSHGMWAHYLRPQDYQELMDRGWRRSGKYCYKPTMTKTCCPQYTIRCPVKDFRLSKSQKKVLKRMHKFLAYGTIRNAAGASATADMDTHSSDEADGTANILQEHPADVVMAAQQNLEDKQLPPSSLPTMPTARPAGKDLPPRVAGSMEVENEGAPACKKKKAKQLRKERKLEKLCKKAKEEGLPEPCPEEVFNKKNPEAKSLEDFLSDPLPSCPAHRLQVKLVRSSPPSPQWEERSGEAFQCYSRYQLSIHSDSPSRCTEKQFRRFLVTSPLFAKEEDECRPAYGSFHQHYLLDDQLIAVGVVDILPTSVSSVYLFYDPAYSFLSLGTYAALREIAFTRELHSRYPEIQFYYMGFYIHSCPKMRYKGQFSPSFLLCPETYIWRPLTECLPLLDKSKYCRLNPDPTAVDTVAEEVDIDKILVIYRRQVMAFSFYKQLKNLSSEDEESVSKYAQMVGHPCTSYMLLYRA